VLVAVIVGCGKSSPPTTTTGSGSAEARCQTLPFVESTPVPEASGAAWLPDGKLFVISDSGNHGAYAVVDPDSGATVETGVLPMAEDVAGDDLEGVSLHDGRYYGLTSAGWVREWLRKDKSFELVAGPYALGPVDLPEKKAKPAALAGSGMVCPAHGVNCGRDFEGLCLAPKPAGPCIGFAAAKADGHLYCLTEEAGKLVVHHETSIAIARGGVMADCAFDETNTLWVGSNLFDLGNVYRVIGWENPATAHVELLDALPIGFPETLAVRGETFIRMSDTGGSPSLMAKFRCSR